MPAFIWAFALKLLTTNAMRKLAVVALHEISKRTETRVDDVAVEVIAEALGVELEKEIKNG